jgi:hypothetical protein
MDVNEFFAVVFLVLCFVCYLFKDKNLFFTGCWLVIKCFFIALFAVLAIGFIKDQFKGK